MAKTATRQSPRAARPKIEMAKNIHSSTRPSPTSGSTPSFCGGLESLCDRQQLLSDWTRFTNLLKPPLEFQGTETPLKHQYKLCAMARLDSCRQSILSVPCQSLRRDLFGPGGRSPWMAGKEDEEEERKEPSSQRLLDRTHQVFRNNLAMCVLAFLQLSQFDACKHDLDSGMLAFGAQISQAGPRSRVIAPCSLQSGMHGETSTNLMYEGSTLKGAMKEDLLFWQREVYEHVRNPSPGKGPGRGKRKGGKKSWVWSKDGQKDGKKGQGICPKACNSAEPTLSRRAAMKNGWICNAPSARRRTVRVIPPARAPGAIGLESIRNSGCVSLLPRQPRRESGRGRRATKDLATTLGRTLAQVLLGASVLENESPPHGCSDRWDVLGLLG